MFENKNWVNQQQKNSEIPFLTLLFAFTRKSNQKGNVYLILLRLNDLFNFLNNKYK
jgi:hypothetical protein